MAEATGAGRFDPLSPPLLTADLPGVGGRLRQQPEDFEVEEIPAYEPCGSGEHLYLWIEKRGVASDGLLRHLSQQLRIPVAAIGMAGLKDRHAVTRQWLSVPAECVERLAAIDSEAIRLLEVRRHRNKLKPGHLRGNRFRILVREADRRVPIEPLLERLRRLGVPNYYGPQRFGHRGQTLELGWKLLRRECPRERSPLLVRLALSAVQSCLFNLYVAQRLTDGLLHQVLEGDVMKHWPVGGLFRVQDCAAEQARFDQRQIVHTGPMFGTRMYPAARAEPGRVCRLWPAPDGDATP